MYWIRYCIEYLVLSYFLILSFHGIAGSCSICFVSSVLQRTYVRWSGRSQWVW